MPQLNPTWFVSQLFWLVVSMVFLYIMLSSWVLPRLLRAIEARESTRSGDLARAQALKSEADAARGHYEKALAEARAQAQTAFAEAEQSAKRSAEKANAELSITLHTRLSEAETRIHAAKHKLLEELQPATAELVSLAVEKLTQKKPDAADVQAALNRIA